MICHTIMGLFLNKADMTAINPAMLLIRIQRRVQQGLKAIVAPSHTAYDSCISCPVVKSKVAPIRDYWDQHIVDDDGARSPDEAFILSPFSDPFPPRLDT